MLLVTTATRFLQQLDPLPAPARERLVAATARQLAGTGELGTLLESLAAQGPHGSRVALRMAVIAGDRDHVEHCLDAPEPAVRALAIAAAVRLALPIALLVERLPDLPAAHRTTLYRALRGQPSTELAEALLPVVQARFGDREAAGLLSSVSHELFSTLLSDLDHAVANWSALGHRHAAQLLSYVEARLSSEPAARWRHTWEQVGPAVAAATASDPGRVLDLLERSLPHAPFPAALTARLGTLARHDAGRVAAVLTDPRRVGRVHPSRKVLKAFTGLPDDDLIALGRAMDETTRFATLLHALPPSRRAAVHAGVVGLRAPVGRAGAGVRVVPRLCRWALVATRHDYLHRR